MDEKKKNRLFLIIVFLLIIIILILLFFTRFGKIENKYLKQTGNVDIFNIDISDQCFCESGYPVWDEEKYKEEFNKIYVDDRNGNYIYQQNLKIFNNAFYEYTNKISPGTSNTYYFVVHNSSDIDVNYYVEMYEITKHDINLKYRLKRNDKYVIGNDNKWVTADELKTSLSYLEMKDSDKYALDWKWEYESGNDSKDTYIGENMNSLYKLNIRFYFEQAEE